MKTTHWTFQAKREDVDLDRIWREAPKGTRLIVVEGADHWYFLVHRSLYDLARELEMPIGTGTYCNVTPKVGVRGELLTTATFPEGSTDYVHFSIRKDCVFLANQPFLTGPGAFQWLRKIDERIAEEVTFNVTTA